MNNTHLMAATVSLAFLCTGAAFAASADQPAWLSGIADQKLEAVDGSSLLLSPSQNGIALSVTAPNGETQKNVYAMMSDKLGTVSDGADGKHLIGFFRTNDTGFQAQFDDGHTETLSLNGGGGVSVTLASAAKGSACMSWYPQGHTFSEAERRAAVAEYAQRLGVNETGKAPAPVHNCDTSAPSRAASVSPAPAHAPMKVAANDKGLVPVLVRTSVVHAVDGAATAAAPAAAIAAPIAVAAAAPKAPPTVSMGPMLEKVSAKSSDIASAEPVEPGHGASDCLSVDSDGTDMGFRNTCAFKVEFSYCLENSDDPAVACDSGARAGNVAANSFAPLVRGANIKDADAEHDVRWVGCTGDESEVEAHLDKTDPPAGRCVRVTAS